MNVLTIDRPHVCPGLDCRGQFFVAKHIGILCTIKFFQMTGGSIVRLMEIQREREIEQSEGLGLA